MIKSNQITRKPTRVTMGDGIANIRIPTENILSFKITNLKNTKNRLSPR